MTKTGRNRRSIKSLNLTRRFHGRYFAVWALGCIVPVVMLNVIIYLLCQKMSELSALPDIAVADGNNFPVMIVVETITLLVGMFGVYLLAVHKISGPFVSLKHTVDRLNGGDLTARLHFRDEDKLGDISDSFNAVLNRLTRAPQSAAPAADELAALK